MVPYLTLPANYAIDNLTSTQFQAQTIQNDQADQNKTEKSITVILDADNRRLRCAICIK
jgi:hypothetical protein